MGMTDHQRLHIDKGLFHKLPTIKSVTLLKSLYGEYMILTAVPFVVSHLPD